MGNPNMMESSKTINFAEKETSYMMEGIIMRDSFLMARKTATGFSAILSQGTDMKESFTKIKEPGSGR
jgi:hypothetical protein